MRPPLFRERVQGLGLLVYGLVQVFTVGWGRQEQQPSLPPQPAMILSCAAVCV